MYSSLDPSTEYIISVYAMNGQLISRPAVIVVTTSMLLCFLIGFIGFINETTNMKNLIKVLSKRLMNRYIFCFIQLETRTKNW